MFHTHFKYCQRPHNLPLGSTDDPNWVPHPSQHNADINTSRTLLDTHVACSKFDFIILNVRSSRDTQWVLSGQGGSAAVDKL